MHNEITIPLSESQAIALFREGRISSGRAARGLGISRVAFLELLHQRGVAYVDYDSGDLADEFAAARNLGGYSALDLDLGPR